MSFMLACRIPATKAMQSAVSAGFRRLIRRRLRLKNPSEMSNLPANSQEEFEDQFDLEISVGRSDGFLDNGYRS